MEKPIIDIEQTFTVEIKVTNEFARACKIVRDFLFSDELEEADFEINDAAYLIEDIGFLADNAETRVTETSDGFTIRIVD